MAIEIWYLPPNASEPHWISSTGRRDEAEREVAAYRRDPDNWPGIFSIKGEENLCHKCGGLEIVIFYSNKRDRHEVFPCTACIKAGRIQSRKNVAA